MQIGGKTATKATGEATEFLCFQIPYELLLHQAIYLWILHFNIFQGYQEHQNWSSNKEVMQVPKLKENQQTLQHLQQERLLYFSFFRYHMSSY